jgi:hypothetical protein
MFNDRYGMIGLLFAVFVQTAGIVWWASTMSTTVDQLERAVTVMQETHAVLVKQVQENQDKLTRIQVIQEHVVKTLERAHGGEPRGPVEHRD